MRIGFIARGLDPGGVKRYIENVLEQFDGKKRYEFILFTDEKDYLKKFKKIKTVFIEKSNKLYWDYIKILPFIKKENIDVLIYPKNIIPFTHKRLNIKKINIIHDLAYFDKELKTYEFLDTLYMTSFMKKSCKIADRTIAISKNTKKEIINHLKIQEDKIKVIYEAVEKPFKKTSIKESQKVLSKFNIKKPFLFYAGSLTPRKNIHRLLSSFSAIKDKVPENIYLTGGKLWNNKKVEELICNLNGRVKRLGNVSERELIALYSEAEVYVYPSLYEGFGLPILEAQACGCPVIASNTTSLPEVGGDSVYYVNPHSKKEIADAILKLISDKILRANLIKKGYENVKRFSWEKCANEILSVCEEIKNE